MYIYVFLISAVCVIVTVALLLFLASLVSRQSLRCLVAEIVFELRYNVLGALSVLDDWVSRETELTEELVISNGKIALITGGTRGIGREVVEKLLQRDMHVIIGCRNISVAQELYDIYRAKGFKTGTVDVHRLDVSSLSSVRSFAKIIKEKYPKIHFLINNAGIMFGPYNVTDDGYESQFATNYLGHFLLTHLLLPLLVKGGNDGERYSRIVNVSSCAHKLGDIDFSDMNSKKQYIPSQAYARSKLAQILFTNYLNKLMKSSNKHVGVYSVHPGLVDTDLFKEWRFSCVMGQSFRRFLFKCPKQGSISIVYACLSRRLEICTGAYISNSRITPTSAETYSSDLQRRLFEYTMNELNIKEFGQE